MQTCCIKGCDSFKYAGTNELSYFNFPIHDEKLLKKWLNQIQLPNWKPRNHRICSLHFAENDLERYPNGQQPLLKLSSVPTIFSSPERKNISNTIHYIVLSDPLPIQTTMQTIDVRTNGNFDPPLLQQTPFYLIPTQYPVRYNSHIAIPSQLQQNADTQDSLQKIVRVPNPNYSEIEFTKNSDPLDEQTTIPVSKFRKILPKPETSSLPLVNQVSKIFPSEDYCKPDILIVQGSRKTNNSNGSDFRSRYPGNKVPTLKISINKLYDDTSKRKIDGTSIETIETSSTRLENSSINVDMPEKSITIENSLATRSVTFRLDSAGEIVVESQEIIKSSRDDECSKPARIKRKVDTIVRPSCKNVRQFYAKGQKDCAKLRERHKREIEEIETLRVHHHELNDRDKKNSKFDETTLTKVRRNEETTMKVEEFIDEKYDNLLHGLTREKYVEKTNECSSTIVNGRHSRLFSLKTKCNNDESKFRVNEDTKNVREDGGEFGEIDVKRISFFHDSESDDITYQEKCF